MPSLRQSLVAMITRRYPFVSGRGTLANSKLVRTLSGSTSEETWARTAGGLVRAPLDDYVGRAAYFTGDLDPKITWICRRLVRPGDTAVDIGANIGIVSLLLAKLVGPSGRLHCFEPNPRMQRLLQSSLERNGVTNATIHRIALGSAEAQLELFVPAVNAGAASLLPARAKGAAQTLTVPVRPLSAVLSEHGIERIHFVKIDVEGFEAEVLRGACELLESNQRPGAILFELNSGSHGSYADEPTIVLLREFGYRFFAVPWALTRVRVEPLDLTRRSGTVGHDVLAVSEGDALARIAES